MRIQHNIMAMNAYRNYTNNVSAMKNNLEKLSSGYKINRAGDDAAGLAISEKMRAQITGLKTAQKNAKDGISLVQTAEGALTEVHDMLNRMVELATQSANGTYDNEVDRAQMQKEIEQLKSEIDRIADSSNFNGIKLLDGSMSAGTTAGRDIEFTLPSVGTELGVDTVLHNQAKSDNGTEFSVELHNFEFNNQKGDSLTIMVGDTEIKLTSNVDHVEGTKAKKITDKDLVKAILDGTSSSSTTGYTVEINDTEYNKGDEFTIDGQVFKFATTASPADVDKAKITFVQQKPPVDEAQEVNGAKKVTVSGDIVAVKAEFEVDLASKTSGTITIGTKAISYTNMTTLKAALSTATITGFTAALDTTAKKLTLTAASAGPKDAPTVTHGEAGSVAAVRAATGSDAAGATKVLTGIATVTASKKGIAIVIGSGTGAKTYKAAFASLPTGASTKAVSLGSSGYTATITAAGEVTLKAAAGTAGNGVKLKVAVGTSATAAGTTAEAVTNANATMGTNGANGTAEKYTYNVTDWESGNITLKKGDGSDVTLAYDAAKAGTASVNGYDVELSEDGKTLTLTAQAVGTKTGATAMHTTTKATFTKAATEIKPTEKKKGADAGTMEAGPNGDYNVSTTDIHNVYAGGNSRLASTYFDLTKDMVGEGTQIKIADETYTFTYDKDRKEEAEASDSKLVYLGDMDETKSDFLSKAAKALTDKATNNQVYTVGHDGSRITVTETYTHANDLKDKTGETKYNPGKWDLRTLDGIKKSLGYKTAAVEGNGLTLQIGDTSDGYNKLNVSIKDMHAVSLGIGEIDISTQEGAADAMDKIKSAINQVSDVRGDLGATQNRLDHTINNLSVMTENIQDAESTIRDVDVAEEMMEYTKNNILIQSAQAMLAQANQVPQGVLQLLG